MSLNIEHTFTAEVEPESISLFHNESHCVLLEITVDVEYDGEELLEHTRNMRVFHNEQDITRDLTRKDFAYISSLVAHEVTENSYDIIDKLGGCYETAVADGRY